jgi:hypothetical protein
MAIFRGLRDPKDAGAADEHRRPAAKGLPTTCFQILPQVSALVFIWHSAWRRVELILDGSNLNDAGAQYPNELAAFHAPSWKEFHALRLRELLIHQMCLSKRMMKRGNRRYASPPGTVPRTAIIGVLAGIVPSLETRTVVRSNGFSKVGVSVDG